MYKFRSMIRNAHILLRTDPKLRKLYDEYRENGFKLNSDPRITIVGGVLRKTSVDELPQLLNVLLGYMSLVGPRAYYPDELAEQESKFPGCKEFVKKALTA